MTYLCFIYYIITGNGAQNELAFSVDKFLLEFSKYTASIIQRIITIKRVTFRE